MKDDIMKTLLAEKRVLETQLQEIHQQRLNVIFQETHPTFIPARDGL